MVIGVSGTGKTAWVRHRIRTTCKTADWLVCDPEGEYQPEDFGGRCTVMGGTDEMADLERDKPGWVYVFRAADGESVARLALDMERVGVVFDEGDQDFRGYLDAHSARWRVLNRGRQHEVSPYVLVRRAADVARTGTANATHAVLCWTREARDLDFIEGWCGKDARAAVEALPHPVEQASKTGVYVVECRVGLDARRVFVPF